MHMDGLMQDQQIILKRDHQQEVNEAGAHALHDALASAVMGSIADKWFETRRQNKRQKTAYYLSAEFLVGRMVYNNLFALGILDEVRAAYAKEGLDLSMFEEIEDAALGNGGLGRLAACFLDSAATHDLPLNGYGIRYKYGLFKQSFRDGFQSESADDWQRFGDPWSRRRSSHEVLVSFADQTVRAVPYDMPIIGYKTDSIGTLRLWQSEAVQDFDFQLFNDQEYALAVLEKNAVEDITRVLYPNDTTLAGKKLRLKQQYFFSSASLQDLLNGYIRRGMPLCDFAKYHAIQLNDTHPTVSIPELIRLLVLNGLSFDEAFAITRETFSYTNHTVMSEALEKWDSSLFKSVIPEIFDIIVKINTKLCAEVMARGMECAPYTIIQGNVLHMANLASYCAAHINGVAEIHTQILKDRVLHAWYLLYPERFCNETNGITQRRWLGLCNPELSAFITARVGDGWLRNLNELEELTAYQSDADLLELATIKREKKEQLRKIILNKEGVDLPADFIFDVQVKRMHEYKRQLLNAFAILDIYYGILDGRVVDFPPTAFIFGAKAAPGYMRAKAIIKFINEIAHRINADARVNDRLRVVFVQNYNCSYAEHIIPAADISEQISPAGTEASGTGNMKLMLNGAVTLGTMDGANVEIVEQAGEENNYIFGYRVKDLDALKAHYHPKAIYDFDPRVRRVVDALIDGSFSDNNSGVFTDLYRSLLVGSSWQKPDEYFILQEFLPYVERKLQCIYDTRDTIAFSRKCLINIAFAGKFSSDRTIASYAKEIWEIEPMEHVKNLRLF
ncbi:MAG: glycogen/starch/alpha-glucan phosphorylase [Clostridiales bacterium]|nr:glycogen/starch/alpha-glucan phosphorylase [Clostridiales bacterium]